MVTYGRMGKLNRKIEDKQDPFYTPQLAAARAIRFLGALIILILFLRLILAYIGVGKINIFASFIYIASNILAEPFYKLTNYHIKYGASNFEVITLVSIIVYTVIFWIIVRYIERN